MCKEIAMDSWDSKSYKLGSIVQNNIRRLQLANYEFCNDGIILDVGCGTGSEAALIAEKYPQAKVVGIDKSKSMVDSAREVYSRFANLEFIEQDAVNINFKNEFTNIISFGCLHWIPGHERLLKIFYDALKPGGEILLVIATKDLTVTILFDYLIKTAKWQKIFKEYKGPFYYAQNSLYEDVLKKSGYVDFKVMEKLFFSPPMDIKSVKWMLSSLVKPFVSSPMNSSFSRAFTEKEFLELTDDYIQAFISKNHLDKVGKYKLQSNMKIIKAKKPLVPCMN